MSRSMDQKALLPLGALKFRIVALLLNFSIIWCHGGRCVCLIVRNVVCLKLIFVMFSFVLHEVINQLGKQIIESQ